MHKIVLQKIQNSFTKQKERYTIIPRRDYLAKQHRDWNRDIYQRYMREGRGQGKGKDYIPWIKIHDFPSRGMVSRVKGITTGRIHHLLSNNELWLFYLLDWSDEVLDIREQYPLLDLQLAVEIAEKAQIRYPFDNWSGFPYVMTSDFYVETTDGPSAIAVKASTDLKGRRVREKLEIERRYWEAKRIKWRLITEKEINISKAQNIEWIYQAQDLGQFCLNEELQESCIEYFMQNYYSNKFSLKRILTETENRYSLAPGIGLTIYRHLIYSKLIKIDISKPINIMDICEKAQGSSGK